MQNCTPEESKLWQTSGISGIFNLYPLLYSVLHPKTKFNLQQIIYLLLKYHMSYMRSLTWDKPPL